jgi:hypothetical protein
LLAGLEFAVKLNHVDAITDSKGEMKFSWVGDGQNGAVDIESVLARKTLKHGLRLELQGPGLSARADGTQLPLKARFIGLALSKDITGPMPEDETPPRVELKIEVKVTDRSLGSLVVLAGAAQELKLLSAELAGGQAAQVIGAALTAAVPVVSGVIAYSSVKRALSTVRDSDATIGYKALAVMRAMADVTSVFFPLVGVVANIALVFGSVAYSYLPEHNIVKMTANELMDELAIMPPPKIA